MALLQRQYSLRTHWTSEEPQHTRQLYEFLNQFQHMLGRIACQPCTQRTPLSEFSFRFIWNGCRKLWMAHESSDIRRLNIFHFAAHPNRARARDDETVSFVMFISSTLAPSRSRMLPLDKESQWIAWICLWHTPRHIFAFCPATHSLCAVNHSTANRFSFVFIKPAVCVLCAYELCQENFQWICDCRRNHRSTKPMLLALRIYFHVSSSQNHRFSVWCWIIFDSCLFN